VPFIALSALLSACSVGESSFDTRLPQRFRLPTDANTAFFERTSGRIAVARADGNVVITDQAQTNETLITRDSDLITLRDNAGLRRLTYGLPIWSPDGSQIALLESRIQFEITTGLTLNGNVVAIARLEPGALAVTQTVTGTIPIVITNTTTFERQASRVTFDYGGQPVSSALFTAPVDGKSALREVHYRDDAIIEQANWSPTGEQLGMLIRDAEGSRTLTVINRDGTNPIDITTGIDVAWDWSPNGQEVVAQTQLSAGPPFATDPARSSVGVFATDNGERLASVASREIVTTRGPQFSADGKFIVVALPRESDRARFDLYLSTSEGKLLRSIFKDVTGGVSYAWSPAGGAQIAFIVRENAQQSSGPLFLLDVNSGSAQLLSGSPSAGFFWSPDGRRIVSFGPVLQDAIDPNSPGLNLLRERAASPMVMQTIDLATRDVRQVLYFEPTDAFSDVLRSGEAYSGAFTIWSPNNRRVLVPILFSPDGAGGPFELIIETEASGSIDPRVVSQGSMATWSPR
jgi:Tol biopolymer transport system component